MHYALAASIIALDDNHCAYRSKWRCFGNGFDRDTSFIHEASNTLEENLGGSLPYWGLIESRCSWYLTSLILGIDTDERLPLGFSSDKTRQ